MISKHLFSCLFLPAFQQSLKPHSGNHSKENVTISMGINSSTFIQCGIKCVTYILYHSFLTILLYLQFVCTCVIYDSMLSDAVFVSHIHVFFYTQINVATTVSTCLNHSFSSVKEQIFLVGMFLVISVDGKCSHNISFSTP